MLSKFNWEHCLEQGLACGNLWAKSGLQTDIFLPTAKTLSKNEIHMNNINNNGSWLQTICGWLAWDFDLLCQTICQCRDLLYTWSILHSIVTLHSLQWRSVPAQIPEIFLKWKYKGLHRRLSLCKACAGPLEHLLHSSYILFEQKQQALKYYLQLIHSCGTPLFPVFHQNLSVFQK